MIIVANNGCLLTQSEEVSIKERRFERSLLVSTIEEAAQWKEIPESERDTIIAQARLFEPERIDYDYLAKMNRLMATIEEKINDAHLSAAQALNLQKYHPQWEKCIGRRVSEGFRCNYNETLVEVVTPHVISPDNPPVQKPVLLALNAEASVDSNKEQSVQYYKAVTANKYLHTKYSANPDGNPMTETPDMYVGIYQDYLEEASDNPADYQWSELTGRADPAGELENEDNNNEEIMSNK